MCPNAHGQLVDPAAAEIVPYMHFLSNQHRSVSRKWRFHMRLCQCVGVEDFLGVKYQELLSLTRFFLSVAALLIT